MSTAPIDGTEIEVAMIRPHIVRFTDGAWTLHVTAGSPEAIDGPVGEYTHWRARLDHHP